MTTQERPKPQLGQTLYDVRTGDEVIYTRTFSDTGVVLSVDRTTPTQIIIGQDRFRKSNGRLIRGRDRWHHCSISVATEEKKARVMHDMKYSLTKRKIHDYCDHIQKVKKVSDSVTLEQLEYALEALSVAYEALFTDFTTTQEES